MGRPFCTHIRPCNDFPGIPLYRDGYVYKKDGPYTKCVVNNTQSKLVANIHDVLVKCGIKDGNEKRVYSGKWIKRTEKNGVQGGKKPW